MRTVSSLGRSAGIAGVVSFICIVLSNAAAYGVEVTFSDPAVVNTSQTYYQAGIFETDYTVSDLMMGEGPEFDLVLMKISSEVNWSMALVDRDGRLVDTVPRFLHPLGLTLSHYSPFSMVAVAWIEPYYHVFESRHDTLFYTRVAVDLTVIDPLPVPYLTGGFQSLVVDGERLWVLGKRATDPTDETYHLSIYEFPEIIPIAVGLDIPYAYSDIDRGMALGPDSLSLENNLYLYAINRDSSSISIFRVTPSGEVDTLARVFCKNVIWTMASRPSFMPLTADTVLMCWLAFKHVDDPYSFRYLKFSGTGSTDTISPTVIDMPLIPVRSALAITGSRYQANSVYVVGSHHEYGQYSRLVRLRFDLTFNYYEYTELYAEERSFSSTSKLAYEQHDTQAFFYYVNGPRVNLLTFSSDGSSPPVTRTSLLYRPLAYTKPTFLADEQGILLYLQKSGADGPMLEGYRFDYDLVPSAVSPFPLILDDTRPMAPRLYNVAGHRALYWCSYHEEGHDDFGAYQGKIAFFDGDQLPTIDYVDVMRLSQCEKCYSPVMAQTDSFAYFMQPRSGGLNIWTLSVWSALYGMRLLPTPSIAYSQGVTSTGFEALTARGDTVFTFYSYGNCSDPHPVVCQNWEYAYWGFAAVRDSIIADNYLEEIYGGGYGPSVDVCSSPLGGDYVLSFKSNFMLKTLDYSTRKLKPVIDLETASGHDFEYPIFHPFTIRLVETADAIAVFFIDEDNYYQSGNYENCHVMIFDKQWNFTYYSKLPLAGVVKDMGDIRYSSEADKIFYSYSTYLPDQYLSPRVVLQSMSIENITGADDHLATLPQAFQVWQNAPNPFNASTRIDFYLPTRSQVTLTVYNLLGQSVKTLLSSSLESGRHSAYWDGTDGGGSTVASGVYIFRVKTDHAADTRKMILLK